jgi:serine-type D-Ala-D-Ala carboxypeptidase/endopeptidase (penicillin-binding protein 4)
VRKGGLRLPWRLVQPRSRRWRTSLAATVATAVTIVACSTPEQTVAVPDPLSDVEPPSTATRPTASTTETTEPSCPPVEAFDVGPVEPPADLVAVVAERLGDARFAPHQLSVSIWVDGWGEVGARDPDQELLPASNEKLFTAMGALELLDPEARLGTALTVSGSLQAGVVHGDLVIVGGGDPTLRRTGGHSIAELANRVHAVGVREVTGSIVVDESRWDDVREAQGWLSWHRPGYAGSLSALLVDGNRYRGDAGFRADPAPANGMLLRNALEQRGVRVAGGIRHGQAAVHALEVARLESPTVRELLHTMVMRSDNMIAEALVKEIGAVTSGVGSTSGGLAAIAEALRARCFPVAGVASDGSGLSRQNFRSAREWRRLLQAAAAQSWADDLVQLLPLAGRSGTLSGRLLGPATAGNVRAKTGSIGPARALSGYFTTAGGRPGTFSVVVNGSMPGGSVPAIDSLVTAVAAHPG